MLDGKLVEGTHEKLISQELFLKVNNIRARAGGKYGVSHKKELDAIPLKLFMKCPKCIAGYTGYIIKKKNLWYYKCRTKGCCCSKNAKRVNEQFIGYLSSYSIKPEYITPLLDKMKGSFYHIEQSQKQQEKQLKTRLAEVEKNIKTVKESFWITKQMDRETFEEFMVQYTEEKQKILEAMPNFSLRSSNLENDLREALTFSSKLPTLWASSSVSLQEKIQKLVFPSGVTYNTKKEEFLTEKVNYVFEQIADLARVSADEQNEKGEDYSPSTHKAGTRGNLSNLFLYDLLKISDFLKKVMH